MAGMTDVDAPITALIAAMTTTEKIALLNGHGLWRSKGIDRLDHTAAGLEALGEHVTPRTAWLIEHHMEAHRLLEGTLGVRARRRLEAREDFDELVLLAECDHDGRARGVAAPELDEAIDYLRELARFHGE